MRNWVIALALAAAPAATGAVVPAAMASDRTDRAATLNSDDDQSAEEIGRQVTLMGEWLLKLEQLSAPAIEGMRGLAPKWQEAMAKPTAAQGRDHFMPHIHQLKRDVAASRAAVAAMSTPALPLLSEGGHSTTRNLRDEMLSTLDQVDKVLDAYPRVLAAMVANNQKAAQAAAIDLVDGVQVLMHSQAVMTSGWIAAMGRDEPARNLVMVDRVFYQVAARLMQATKRIAKAQGDPGLARELLDSATDIDARLGEFDVLLLQQEANIAEMDSLDDAGRAGLVAKLGRVAPLQRKYATISAAYARQLRRTSAVLQARNSAAPIPMATLQPLINGFRDTRIQLDAISVQIAELLAGTR